MGRLGSGPRLVGRMGSGVGFIASFQTFASRRCGRLSLGGFSVGANVCARVSFHLA